jgi:hypothetical protein
MTLRFVPQSTLDSWVEQGRVDPLADRIIDLQTKAEYPVREAVRFLKVESGVDEKGWVKKVKALAEVKASGGDHYQSSVIVGDTVYEVVAGWLAEDGAATAAPKPPANKKFEGKNQEADLLAKLLLDKLS